MSAAWKGVAILAVVLAASLLVADAAQRVAERRGEPQDWRVVASTLSYRGVTTESLVLGETGLPPAPGHGLVVASLLAPDELDALAAFANHGGRIVVAGDPLAAERVGASIAPVLIAGNASLADARPVLDRRPGARVLAWSANDTFLDANGDGRMDAGDVAGPFALATLSPDGRTLVVGSRAWLRDPTLVAAWLAPVFPPGTRVALDDAHAEPLATALARAIPGALQDAASRLGLGIPVALLLVGAALAWLRGEESLTAHGRAALLGGAAALGLAVVLGSLAAAALGLSVLGALTWALATTLAPRARATRATSAAIGREDIPLRVEVRVESNSMVDVADALADGLELVEGAVEGRGRSVVLAYAVVPRAPGRYAMDGIVVRATDPLGLVQREHSLRAPAPFTALPSVEDLRSALGGSRRFLPASGPHLVGQQGSGSDFFALREYQPGDTLRDVNWRASARAGGKLIVSQREMESQAEAVVFLDARALAAEGPAAASAWSRELRALASLAQLLARRRDKPVVVRYGSAVETHRPIAGDADLSGVIAKLLETPPTGEGTLAQAVDAVLPRLRRRAPAILLSSLRDDPSLPSALAALRALELEVVVLAVGEPDAQVLTSVRGQGAEAVVWGADEPLALALAREAP